MITSACSRSWTLSYPCARSWPRTSSLSSTFIWQPKVSRYSFLRMRAEAYVADEADSKNVELAWGGNDPVFRRDCMKQPDRVELTGADVEMQIRRQILSRQLSGPAARQR